MFDHDHKPITHSANFVGRLVVVQFANFISLIVRERSDEERPFEDS